MKKAIIAALVAGALSISIVQPAAAVEWPIEFSSLNVKGGFFDPETGWSACGVTGYTPVGEGTYQGGVDAYDGGLLLAWDGAGFDDGDGLGDLNKNTLKVGPTTVGSITMSRTDTTLRGGATLRDLVMLKNPSGNPVSGVLTFASNFGSDSNTGYAQDSSGDFTITPADRWVITVEEPSDSDSDPYNTTVLYGKGAVDAKVDSVVSGADGNECLKVTMNVTIPAGATRYMLFFAEYHPATMPGGIQAEEDAMAYNKIGLNDRLLAGLSDRVRGRVLNFAL